MKSIYEDAVSPVIGVMLMLVVCIIIAAVVSGFAGSLTGNTEKVPQMTMKTDAYKQDNTGYILLTHNGGEPLSAENMMVKTFIPSGTFKDASYEVADWRNATYVKTGQTLKSAGSWGTWDVTMMPGDSIKIDWTNAFPADCYGTPGGASPNVGEPLNIEVYDTFSGNLIVSSQTTVKP